ncbi:NADPH oxidase 4-like [Exaiptasia diaphana]|uniref:Ferric oxidoreductase domain-containing protein n=1 Tax=Exaiptasia diaphana TaxID=2652724 RepID=A0A913YT56_EXADI|nr:NADPH oxidase 4-like [Exaiptasia diaphana]
MISRLIPWMIYLTLSGAIFFQSYYKYKFCPQYFYLHSMLGFPIQGLKRLLDENVGFHKICAFITVAASVIHTIAHLINAENFSKHYNQDYADLNFAKFKDQNPLVFVLCSVAGSTGILMMVILMLMIGTSMPVLRRSSYEVFWYSHHFFIAFYILLAVHGLG